MFSDDATALLASITEASSPLAERRARARALGPVVRDAAHGLAVAADALTGPDPEFGAQLLRDALRDLAEDLKRLHST